jgi:hypothetical protein
MLSGFFPVGMLAGFLVVPPFSNFYFPSLSFFLSLACKGLVISVMRVMEGASPVGNKWSHSFLNTSGMSVLRHGSLPYI